MRAVKNRFLKGKEQIWREAAPRPPWLCDARHCITEVSVEIARNSQVWHIRGC